MANQRVAEPLLTTGISTSKTKVIQQGYFPCPFPFDAAPSENQRTSKILMALKLNIVTVA